MVAGRGYLARSAFFETKDTMKQVLKTRLSRRRRWRFQSAPLRGAMPVRCPPLTL